MIYIIHSVLKKKIKIQGGVNIHYYGFNLTNLGVQHPHYILYKENNFK